MKSKERKNKFRFVELTMEVSLKDIGTIITGNTPSKKDKKYWDSKDICFVKPDIIGDDIDSITNSNEYISNFASSKARIVKRNTILITCIGNIGRIGIVSKEKIAFNQQINAIIPNSKINLRYLAYVLLFSRPRLKALANAAVVPIVNKTQLESFKIEIDPELEHQDKIANTLDEIEKIKKIQNKEIEYLDTLIKARFVEMFGDPVKNEKKFLTKQLSQIGKCKNGINFHKSEIGNTVNCLTVKDFENNQVINDTTKLAKIKLSNLPSNDYFLNNGDIVFVRSNGNKSLVGRSVLIFPNNNPTLFSGFCIRFRKDSKRLESVYLLWLLKNESIRMKMRGRGVNIQNLNQQIINNLSIPVPPIELQKEFASFVQQVDKSKVAIQKSLDETQILFDSLMQKYFS